MLAGPGRPRHSCGRYPRTARPEASPGCRTGAAETHAYFCNQELREWHAACDSTRSEAGMWADLVEAALAILGFVFLPFAVIATVAGVLMLFDRLVDIQRRHHWHSPGMKH